jgi:hypothetical protein
LQLTKMGCGQPAGQVHAAVLILPLRDAIMVMAAPHTLCGHTDVALNSSIIG